MKDKEDEEEEEENVPVEPKKHYNNVIVKVWDTRDTIFTDQTRKFPYQSVDGHSYLMVMVEIDSNIRDADPMKNKTGKEHIRAYLELLKRMKATGVCNPKKHILDNEASN